MLRSVDAPRLHLRVRRAAAITLMAASLGCGAEPAVRSRSESPSGGEPSATAPAPAAPACAASTEAAPLDRENLVRAATGDATPLSGPPVVLPAAWPAHGGRVELAFFERTALPTGVVAYRVRGPVRRVLVSARDGALTRQPVEGPLVDDVERPSPDIDDRRAALLDAEDALLAVVAGSLCLDEALPRLRPYCAWRATDSVEARWASEVAAPFFAALGCDGD